MRLAEPHLALGQVGIGPGRSELGFVAEEARQPDERVAGKHVNQVCASGGAARASRHAPEDRHKEEGNEQQGDIGPAYGRTSGASHSPDSESTHRMFWHTAFFMLR